MKWESPLSIPAGRSGKYEITKTVFPAMTDMNVVNLRTALFSGVKPEKVIFYEPVTFHYLREDGNILMSDIPEEQYDHIHVVEKCSGTVLVAGLGLGYIATLLSQKKSVNKVIIVELNKDVIELVWKHIKTSKMEIIHKDIWDYLKETKQRFDYVYLDTWSGTGETEFYETTLPMRRASYAVLKKEIKQPRKRVLAWKEEVMRGQISTNFITLLQIPPVLKELMDMPDEAFEKRYNDMWGKPKYYFWKWLRKTKPSKEKAMKEAIQYAQDYGEACWEKKWR